MPHVKGASKDGVILVNSNIDFRGTVLGAGSPGYPPKRASRYFVDGLNGLDARSGKSWAGAKKTIAAAITAMNATLDWTTTPWADSHILYIAPGSYAENLTALPYGCTIIGLGNPMSNSAGYGGVTIMPATGAAVDVTSALDGEIHNVCFRQVATAGAIFQADNFNGMWLNGCVFQGIPGASPTSTRGFEVVKDMTRSRLTKCYFMQCKSGVYINTDNANSKQIISSLFEDITIHCADTAGFYFDINSNPAGVLINRCNVGDPSTTLALGLDDNTDQVAVANSNFWATNNDPAATGANYNNCYLNSTLL